MITATATAMQNNFGRYLNLVMSGQEIIVTKNGKEVGRFIPKEAACILPDRFSYRNSKRKNDLAKIKEEDLKAKYGIVD